MNDVLGAVLAGGAGTRLGQPKAGAMLVGRPLAAWPLEALHEAGIEAVIVTRRDSLPLDLGVPTIHDTSEIRHPLAGILAALEHAGGRAVLAVGADLPFVTGPLLAFLAGLAAEVVVPDHDGRLHALCARYAPATADALRTALSAQAPLQRTLAALSPRLVTDAELRPFGDPGRLLFNVNRPEDLAAAEASLRPSAPPPSSRSAPPP